MQLFYYASRHENFTSVVQIRNIFVTTNTAFEKIDITHIVVGFWGYISGHVADIATVLRSKQFYNIFSYACKNVSLFLNIRLINNSSKLKKPEKMRFFRFFKSIKSS